ncbi:threonine/serine ThrE exporter family protein [Bifidobacterium bifidum]|uniref:threonine/serine ThrE exporter family protein n=1 Tax=Bifidobacterium bifidum TaxID=1681 RepID=UPI003CFDFF4E
MQQHKNGDAPHQDAATAVSHFHTHSVPLDMEDIRRDWDKPISEAGLAAKTSVVVRVGALDLGAGTGSFRVREMMHRIAYPLGVHVRADVNLTDIEATCTDDANRITEVIDLPTTGVNTERIWLLEHYTDWFSVNLGLDSMYHRAGDVSEGVVQNLEQSDMSEVSAQLAKKLRAEKKAQKELSGEASDDPVLDALEAAEVTVPVSMVRAAAADIAAEGSTDDELRSESEAALKEDREAKLLHDRLMQLRSGKHDFVETPDLDAAAAAAGGTGADAGAGASASSAEDQNLNEFGTSMSAEALLGAKRRRTRAHKPLTGEYAEHFDHVGRSAGEGRKPITVRQAHERLDLIESRKPLYSPAFAGFASAVACASFVFLLGGGPYDMIGAFVGAGLGHWLRRKLFAHHLNQFFVTFVCVALAALACTGTLRLIGLLDPIALTHDTAYIGAMLFVIPGFPLITGGLDMAKIDFPSGIQRVAYVLCIILMATLAGWGVAMIVHLNPTGFEPLGLNPWMNTGLRAVTAFLGVWGFSIMFNSPQRMCLVAATIGMITDTLRLTLVDFGVPAEAGAFIGALLAGLLAAGWRTAVHNGLLPPHLGYPRICLTVPSIVIMVPGLYMYRAMFYLGQFDTLHALDWAFRAFMVIICLPIGLAMARVITDKSWRYDV